MVSVALHFAVSGLALLYFGPEGMRTTPLVRGAMTVLGLSVPALSEYVKPHLAETVFVLLLLSYLSFGLTENLIFGMYPAMQSLWFMLGMLWFPYEQTGRR